MSSSSGFSGLKIYVSVPSNLQAGQSTAIREDSGSNLRFGMCWRGLLPDAFRSAAFRQFELS